MENVIGIDKVSKELTNMRERLTYQMALPINWVGGGYVSIHDVPQGKWTLLKGVKTVDVYGVPLDGLDNEHSIIIYYAKAGTKVPEHRHETYTERLVVMDGIMHLKVNGKMEILKATDGRTLYPKDYHEVFYPVDSIIIGYYKPPLKPVGL